MLSEGSCSCQKLQHGERPPMLPRRRAAPLASARRPGVTYKGLSPSHSGSFKISFKVVPLDHRWCFDAAGQSAGNPAPPGDQRTTLSACLSK